MNDKLDQLKEIIGEVADLNAAMSLLGWDQQTYMPAGGSEARGQHLATLGKTRAPEGHGAEGRRAAQRPEGGAEWRRPRER